jgi:hypothetical protein
MNVEIGTEAVLFPIWKYLFRIYGIVSLQCILSHTSGGSPTLPHMQEPGKGLDDHAVIALFPKGKVTSHFTRGEVLVSHVLPPLHKYVLYTADT